MGAFMKSRRLMSVMVVLALGMGLLGGCGQASPSGASQNEVSEQSVGDITQAMTDDAAEQLGSELGAFEITAEQRELAKANLAGYAPLDAGRGNPNWINAKVRHAFTRLMDFATAESERTMSEGDMAGQAQAEGIGKRFEEAMDKDDEADAFLLEAVRWCVDELGMDEDALVKELVDGITGDYYPSPSRCLALSEEILGAYLQSTLYDGVDLRDSTRVFPTEGGSAAMCYIFHSLSHNRLLNPGDKIAIATPIFTPYLQIPDVNDYGLVSVDVTATAESGWDIPEGELAKLEDPSIKAFFLVNPSNPASHALSERSLQRLEQAVKANPGLIILTDDVYGTFVDDFQSVYSRLPHNTILVYSFSKLYGVTGWRTGIIAMNDDNVCDELIERLPAEDKAAIDREYSIVTEAPASMPFIDRVTADSRSIGLYHTSGLSTPSQVFMDLMALSHLVAGDTDPYIEQSKALVNERYEALMEGLGLEADTSRENAQYYALVDIRALVARHYGEDYAAAWEEGISDLDFLYELAEKKGVVLMYGPGFEAPKGCVRISLANLNAEDYTEIARRIKELLDEQHAAYEEDVAVPEAA